MPLAIGPILVKVFGSMMVSLLTEKFLKGVIIILLEKMVASTSNDMDDKLLNEVKEALK